jgi:hypothetical protein
MGAPPIERVRSQVKMVIDILDAIEKCATLLIRAEEDERISFDDQVVPTSLEIVSRVTGRASEMAPDELEMFLTHLRVDGPEICEEMIRETVNRLPPIMHREYLIQKLVKPPGA